MLGLGNALTGGAVTESALTPSDISGLEVWYKVNKGIAGASNTSDDGNMVDGEDIYSWADQSGNSNHAITMTSAAQRPHWETDAADFGGALFDGSNDGMQLTSDVTMSANQDFTVMVRVKITSFASTAKAVWGNSAHDVLKMPTGGKKINVLLGGSGASSFEEASDTLATDKYYIITLTRSNGSDGDLEVRVHGDTYSDKSWDAAESHQDADELDIGYIGVNTPGALEMPGVIKDFIVWKGTALSDSQRSDMYTYILAQDY